MIYAVRHVLIILLIIALSSVCEAFRIRQTGVTGYGDLNHDMNSHIRQRRRADYNSLLQQRMLDEDNSYFNPNSDLDSEDFLRPMPSYFEDSLDNGYYPDNKYKKVYPKEYPTVYRGLDRRIDGPQKRTAYNPHRVVPTVQELERLFGSADVPMKRSGAMKRRVPTESNIPDTNQNYGGNDDEETSSRQENLIHSMRKLIDAAEKITKNGIKTVEKVIVDGKPEIVKDVVVEKISPDGETKTKIEEVFKEAINLNDSGDNRNAIEILTDEDTETGMDDETESPSDEMNEIINENLEQAQSKSKRASRGLEESVYVGELLKEIATLKKKVAQCKLLQLLEDKENDYLANGLKFATLDQIDGADDFVSSEYNDITKATETEELIQLLSQDLDETDNGEYEEAKERLTEYLEPEGEIEEAEDEIKRSDNRGTLSGKWYEEPVQENVFGAQLEQPTNEYETGIVPYAGSEMPENIPYMDDDDDEEDAEEAEQEAIEEAALQAKEDVDKEIAEENKEENEEEVLQRILQGLSSGELQELVSALKIRNDVEVDDDMCPAVLELSENCAFADIYRIPIDDDARSLCSRHQVCYTCGEGFGLTRQSCDLGYKATVIEACEGDNKCMRNAVMFLGLMEQYHNYELYSPDLCREPCVESFVTGTA